MRQKLLSLFILLILGLAGLEGRGQVVLTEDFSSITTGNSTSTSGSGTIWGGNTNFPTVSSAYQAGGAVKLGTGSATGSITSKEIDLSANSGSFTVSFKVKGWTSVEGSIIVSLGTVNKTVTYTAKIADDFESKSVSFTGGTIASKIKIATSAKRAFIDDVVITSVSASLPAPTLVADNSDNDVDHNIDITFTDDAAWRAAITSVKDGSTTLNALTDYVLSAGNLQLKPSGGNSTLQTSGSRTITVEATGYSDATVTQDISFGAASKLFIQSEPTAPAVNGGNLAAQPIVEVTDQYGNTVESSAASVTAAVGAGSWTIGGTSSVNAASGVATFTDLTASSASSVNGATITFTSGSLTSATSTSFNIPAPLLATPVATAATEVSANSFKANWNSVSGATGYKLDVSEQANFSISGGTANITEGFTGFPSSTPSGWIITPTGTYTTSGNYGLSSPSIKLETTGHTITTPVLSGNATQLSFWIKGNGTNAVSSLKVEGYDGSTWVEIDNKSNLPTTGTTVIYNSTSTPALPSNLVQFKFTYTKGNGNLAFDDVNIDYTGSTPSFITGYNNKSVSGTSDIINGLEANKTYYYRVRATDGSQTTDNSNTITATTIAAPVVSVFSGTGNWFDFARWSNGIPATTTNATISGNATVNGDAKCNNLTISSTASLTVPASNGLYVYGDFDIQSSGALTGSFIGAGNTIIDGNSTVHCYVSADNYHYISSPVGSQTFGSIFPDNQNNIYLRSYNEPTGEWVNQLGTDNSVTGIGYSVTMNAAQTGSFIGDLNAIDVTKTLSKVGVATGPDADKYNGWNLIGNPFSSAIDWAGVLAANPAAGFEGSAYIWSGSNYIATNGVAGGISGNLIPICSGFFVTALTNGAQIEIPTSAQAHSNHGIYKEAILNNLAVKVTGDQYEDQTFVRFHDQATEGFDSRWDARKLDGLNEAPQLYTTAGEYKLSINEQPKQSKRDIPMNFSCGVDGQYTLTFSGVESFESPSRITLEDKLLGSTIDVTNSLSYNFSYNTTDDEGRFILHFSTATGISDKEVQNIQIWAANHQLFIDNQAGVVGDVTLYDITGKKILAKQVTEGKSTINVNGLNGAYIVRIATVKGVVTKKVVLL